MKNLRKMSKKYFKETLHHLGIEMVGGRYGERVYHGLNKLHKYTSFLLWIRLLLFFFNLTTYISDGSQMHLIELDSSFFI